DPNAAMCPGFGSEPMPFCALADALTSGDPLTPLVVPLVAGPADIAESIITTNQTQQRTIAILGDGDVRLTGEGTGPIVSVASGSRIFLSRVFLRASDGEAIRCNNGSVVWLDDARIGE